MIKFAYMLNKDSYEAKFQLLIKKCEGADLKSCNDSKAFIDY